MEDITYLCKRTVVSTKPIQPGKFYFPSVVDRVMEPNNLRLVFYYPTPPELPELGKSTKKLRESFSEMLTSFPMVTGRLQKTPEGHWKVKCNDAGVRTIEARAKGSVEEWLQKVDRDQELKLVYWEDIFHKPYFWSTFYIQLTEFEGGGIAIGLSCTHLLADATCATMMFKAWADTTLHGKMLEPLNFQTLPPRRVLSNKDTNLIDYYKTSLTQNSTLSCSQRYATATFSFTDEMVKKCMSEAGTSRSSSPFTALASLFWLSVSKVKGTTTNMSICLDKRSALGLDQGFFGNCMIFNGVSGEDIREAGLTIAAKAIANVVENMGSEAIMDLVEWLEFSHHQTGTPINGPDLICANWEKLDSYSAEFEPGVKPIRVSYYFENVFGEGQVLILPSPDGCMSRVAMVTLPQHEAVKLCDEALILRFSPTILMGGKN